MGIVAHNCYTLWDNFYLLRDNLIVQSSPTHVNKVARYCEVLISDGATKFWIIYM